MIWKKPIASNGTLMSDWKIEINWKSSSAVKKGNYNLPIAHKSSLQPIGITNRLWLQQIIKW